MNMQSHEQVEYRSSVADLAVSATIHCLTRCAIGEINGLILDATLGWSVLTTVVVEALPKGLWETGCASEPPSNPGHSFQMGSRYAVRQFEVRLPG